MFKAEAPSELRWTQDYEPGPVASALRSKSDHLDSLLQPEESYSYQRDEDHPHVLDETPQTEKNEILDSIEVKLRLNLSFAWSK